MDFPDGSGGGSPGDGGGGGSGFGGAVFVYGCSLSAANTMFLDNSAVGGAAGGVGASGQSYGGAIFAYGEANPSCAGGTGCDSGSAGGVELFRCPADQGRHRMIHGGTLCCDKGGLFWAPRPRA